ncbi:MAG TPA: accessory Sec system translocase SecA2 [Clostridia bacterium]
MQKFISKIKKVTAPFDFIHSDRKIKEYENIVKKINSLNFEKLSRNEILSKSFEISQKASNGTDEKEILILSFALVKEAVKRTLSINAFDTQLMAAAGLCDGNIVEMQTGEGKTLSAVFCAYLKSVYKKRVHILTFNDYLAKRDAEWMKPVYDYLGLSESFISEGMGKDNKKKAYNVDVTYVTAKEAGFDFLRDNLCYEKEDMVHRDFNCAIVDEADSILIDEARVPLIIAGNAPADNTMDFNKIAAIIAGLEAKRDYDTDEYMRNVYLTDSGIDIVERGLSCKNIFAEENLDTLCAVNNALHAKVLLKRGVDYLVKDGKIELVDEFTGRIAKKRHLPEGLQTAVEAKEGLEVGKSGKIMGTITLQSFLRMYPSICGMTATAKSSAEELREVYRLNIVSIPTNRPSNRIDHPDVIFQNEKEKINWLLSETVKIHKIGRPVLIGTASVEESETVYTELQKEGVNCNVLNAGNDFKEAEIIAEAGAKNAVTVSTNMAGRGVDIRLGGSDGRDREEVVKLGGLMVIGTNRHESPRIDLQLRGRAGRQGDPGSSIFCISLHDDLIKKFGVDSVIPKKYKQESSGIPIQDERIRQGIGHIQRVIDGQNFEIRKTLSKYSFFIEEQRKIVHGRRQKVLLDSEPLSFLLKTEMKKYKNMLAILGEQKMQKIEKRITLYSIDRFWSDYLEYVNCIRDGIHLVTIGGKNPLDVFMEESIKVFDGMDKTIDDRILKMFKNIEATEDEINLEEHGIKGPSSTWTYITSDNYFENYLAGKKNIFMLWKKQK